MKPLKDERAQIGFLNFASWDEFQMSKIGVLYDLYGCIEKELSEYVRLDFQTYPITKTLPLRKADLDAFKDVIGKSVQEKRIRLVDKEGNPRADPKPLAETENLGRSLRRYRRTAEGISEESGSARAVSARRGRYQLF